MALAHSQVYSFYHWTKAYDGNADGLLDSIARHWWYQIKEAFVAAGWTVMGTAFEGAVDNSGVTANVDGLGAGAGVDLITGPPTDNNRVWMVLQCPPIMGDGQVMIFSDQPMNNNPEYWQLEFSPLGQFMANNGGVDGDAGTTPPTAPDSYQHYSNTYNSIHTSGSYSANIHACWSADKSQFFIVVNQEAANAQFFGFSVLENPNPDLDNGLVWTMIREGANPSVLQYQSAMTNTHYTNTLWYGMLSGTVEPMYLGGRGWANLGVQNLIRIPDDGKAPPGPCELYGSTISKRAFYGRVPDLYWGPDNHFQKGFADAVDDPPKWYSGGALILPWDVLEPMPRVR